MLERFPEFPQSRAISLQDRESIESFFEQFPSETSERTFGAVYIWRLYEGRSRVSRCDGHLIITWFRQKYGNVMLCPVGPEPASIIERLSKSGPEERGRLAGAFAVTEPVVSDLRSRGMEPVSLRDEWDYVYLTKDLIALEGSRYHTQRKEMNKVTSEHTLRYEPMTKEHQAQCMELEETWCDVKHCTLDKLSTAEDMALREALMNLDELGFVGGVVLSDGKIEALTIGERLSKITAVVHFEKANPSIRGLYQVINQSFCANALKDYEFVNREQDVGEPGLRRAKEGYHPHHFVEKHYLPFP